MAVAPNGSFLGLGLRQHGRVRRRRAARRSILPPVLESASGGDLAKLPAATLRRLHTTSVTLRVLVTRSAAARYSVTRYSEPGPVCAILSYLLTRSRRRHVRPSQSWDPPSPPLLWAFLIRRGTQKVKLSPRLIY